MVTSLFKYERITTTDAKAKALRSWADHLITLAKRGDLHARRQALAIVREKEVVHKLFNEATQKFGSVQGGYTRVVKLGMRPGDKAPTSIIELITTEKPKKKKAAKKKDKAAAKKPAAAGARPKKTAEALQKAEAADSAEAQAVVEPTEKVEDNKDQDLQSKADAEVLPADKATGAAPEKNDPESAKEGNE
jgi:large subunit ribosomal protein L17